MDLELPDGTVVQGIPDGLSKAEITNRLVTAGYGASLSSAEDRAAADPTRGRSALTNFVAGWGKNIADWGRGAGQIATQIATAASPAAAIIKPDAALQAEVDESKRLDAPLMNTGAGLAGNITSKFITGAPLLAIPGANTYTGAAMLGAGQGAIEPVQTGGSRGTNMAIGGAGGFVGQGAGNLIGRVIRPVQPNLTPQQQALASSATAHNIPLSVGQQTGSRPLQIAESVMENLPFSSGGALAQKQAQRDAYNAAVLQTAGIQGNKATPTVLAAQKSRVGGELGDIAKRNSLDFSQGLSRRLEAIVADAAEHLPPDRAAAIDGTVRQILSGQAPGTPARSVPSTILSASGAPFQRAVPATPGAPMPGTNYQGWREPLRAFAKKGDELSHYYGQIRSALDDAFRMQLPGAEGDTFRRLSGEYSNIKTIANAMGGAGRGTKTGDIPPSQLEAALTQQVGREGKALGRGGPLNELVGVGRQFVSESIPDSGTAQRQFIQSLLTTGGGASAGAGAGAGYAALTGGDLKQGALLGAGLTASGLLMPRLVQGVLGTDAMQRYLTRGLLSLTPAERQAINAAATAVGPQLGLLSMQQ